MSTARTIPCFHDTVCKERTQLLYIYSHSTHNRRVFLCQWLLISLRRQRDLNYYRLASFPGSPAPMQRSSLVHQPGQGSLVKECSSLTLLKCVWIIVRHNSWCACAWRITLSLSASQSFLIIFILKPSPPPPFDSVLQAIKNWRWREPRNEARFHTVCNQKLEVERAWERGWVSYLVHLCSVYLFQSS